MSRAIMPHEEISEYLPTQAIADYLAIEAGLDGIIFPSVQSGQKSTNVVLFHHAAKVEEIDAGGGTEVDVHLESRDSDGHYPDYWVMERQLANKAESKSSPFDIFLSGEIERDSRKPSLCLNKETIKVHHIEAVYIEAEAFEVTYHQITRS